MNIIIASVLVCAASVQAGEAGYGPPARPDIVDRPISVAPLRSENQYRPEPSSCSSGRAGFSYAQVNSPVYRSALSDVPATYRTTAPDSHHAAFEAGPESYTYRTAAPLESYSPAARAAPVSYSSAVQAGPESYTYRAAAPLESYSPAARAAPVSHHAAVEAGPEPYTYRNAGPLESYSPAARSSLSYDAANSHAPSSYETAARSSAPLPYNAAARGAPESYIPHQDSVMVRGGTPGGTPFAEYGVPSY